jgi:hypothetical protein
VRYVPDGSLCTASVEQIFPRDGVQRNCFELALYIMTASPIASVRVFETALPTLSVRVRAIIVLNHHRFWGYASGPSSSGNTLPSSIHGHAARRSALPRERFSPLALSGRRPGTLPCPMLGEEQTSFRDAERSAKDPEQTSHTVNNSFGRRPSIGMYRRC